MIKHEKLKNFLSTVPALLGWAALMLVIWGFVFLRLDDVSPERKLIIYTDCDIVNARELMINLEDECGISSDREYVFGENDIRKIKLYTTSFFSALSDPLGDGDLFIISETVVKDLEDEPELGIKIDKTINPDEDLEEILEVSPRHRILSLRCVRTLLSLF